MCECLKQSAVVEEIIMQENECVKHKNCGDCEYAFEHLIGYGDYVCDIDVEPIDLNLMRDDCPLMIQIKEVA